MALSLIVVGLFLFRPVAAKDVPRITAEELKGILGNPDVVVLDVRYSQNWQDSDLKIKSAIRGNPDNFSSWFDQFPKDKTLVLY
jgi:rhodanese-related sulfurtransferase